MKYLMFPGKKKKINNSCVYLGSFPEELKALSRPSSSSLSEHVFEDAKETEV